MVIGITGGVGCGKSTVLRLLEEKYRAKTILADEIGHEALAPDSPVYARVCETFGGDIVGGDGQIDRKKLADLVYQSDEKRESLNRIIHPYVLDVIRERLLLWKEEPLVCLETALLFETGCDRLCDRTWYVMAPKETRIHRLMTSRGYTRARAESIMDAQLSDEEWEKRCDLLLENNGNIKNLERRLKDLLCTESIL